ncbi:hypothetical protein GQ55_2G147200 [Panicum hallii var. hallii]|uniref:Uncharacterized protein n=1 Tax=Panicum hallii var. hallii TaxID=1504633 RepID=A0A2T7EPS6_9POAL|nr:hypothetical protein GQ55_2G147200 [Panicum hallii var. hallii]
MGNGGNMAPPPPMDGRPLPLIWLSSLSPGLSLPAFSLSPRSLYIRKIREGEWQIGGRQRAALGGKSFARWNRLILGVPLLGFMVDSEARSLRLTGLDVDEV